MGSFGASAATLVFFVAVVSAVPTSFNLFLKSHEVHRLLGLNAELYYVREGIINHYALEFVMPVPAHISELRFTWRNMRSTPIHYNIDLTVSNVEALSPPLLNISKKGIVPSSEEIFKVQLPCTGKVDAEVEVQIQVNISSEPNSNNVSSLTLRRNKICLKDGKKNSTVLMVDASAMVATNHSLYIGVGCACTLIVFIIIISAVCYLHTQKTRRTEAMNISFPSYRSNSPALSAQGQTFLRVDTPNNVSTTGSKCSYTSFRRITPLSVSSVPVHVNNELRSTELNEQIGEILVERRKLALQELLQEGTFGKIYRAVLFEEENEVCGDQQVFVKSVSDQASNVQISLLITEGMLMFGTSHKNILPVVAVCMEDPLRPLLVYPYANQGNLKRFLMKCKFSAEGHCHTLLTQDLVDMAIQVVHAMIYLHKKKIVHKDLAVRNCVVTDRLQVRLADNALSRDLFPNEYHCLGDNENRPVKWLAIESLLKKEFSTASDVWAFGVTLWELMTLGQMPYVEIDPFEMGANLRDGYRLTQPINCPDKLYAMMAYCWTAAPEDRPTFPQLLLCLQDFYQALGRYI